MYFKSLGVWNRSGFHRPWRPDFPFWGTRKSSFTIWLQFWVQTIRLDTRFNLILRSSCSNLSLSLHSPQQCVMIALCAWNACWWTGLCGTSPSLYNVCNLLAFNTCCLCDASESEIVMCHGECCREHTEKRSPSVHFLCFEVNTVQCVLTRYKPHSFTGTGESQYKVQSYRVSLATFP